MFCPVRPCGALALRVLNWQRPTECSPTLLPLNNYLLCRPSSRTLRTQPPCCSECSTAIGWRCTAAASPDRPRLHSLNVCAVAQQLPVDGQASIGGWCQGPSRPPLCLPCTHSSSEPFVTPSVCVPPCTARVCLLPSGVGLAELRSASRHQSLLPFLLPPLHFLPPSCALHGHVPPPALPAFWCKRTHRHDMRPTGAEQRVPAAASPAATACALKASGHPVSIP